MVEDNFLSLKDSPEAFERFFKTYYPKLMAYCRLLLDEDSANDIVQDVFVYIWDNRSRLDFGKGFCSYLFQCAYSKCLDVLRHESTIQSKLFDMSDALLNDELEWMKGNQTNILEELNKKDIYLKIDRLIETLPANRRKVFILSFKKNLSNDEISELLDMPKRTVESHLYLILKFLRSKLSREELLIFILCCVDNLI